MPKSMTFWDVVAADAKAAGGAINPKAFFIKRHIQAFTLRRWRPGFACVFWLRVNESIAGKRFSVRLRNWRNVRFASDISEMAQIGPGLWLPHPSDIVIGSGARLGHNVTLFNGVTIGGKGFVRVGGQLGDMPVLGNSVVAYAGAKIIGGITIGDNSHIGALALCNKDVPADSVMYGIPPNATIRPK